jgi:hypothetical protein
VTPRRRPGGSADDYRVGDGEAGLSWGVT